MVNNVIKMLRYNNKQDITILNTGLIFISQTINNKKRKKTNISQQKGNQSLKIP